MNLTKEGQKIVLRRNKRKVLIKGILKEGNTVSCNKCCFLGYCYKTVHTGEPSICSQIKDKFGEEIKSTSYFEVDKD